jgi:hypothetical protein
MPLSSDARQPGSAHCAQQPMQQPARLDSYRILMENTVCWLFYHCPTAGCYHIFAMLRRRALSAAMISGVFIELLMPPPRVMRRLNASLT